METKYLIGGLLAGVVIGVAAGMLFAPASGEETQRKISDRAKKLADSLRDTAEESIQSLKDRFNQTVDEVAEDGKKLAKEGINATSEKMKA